MNGAKICWAERCPLRSLSTYLHASYKDSCCSVTTVQNILKNAGEKVKDTVFLFNDMQIKEEVMVEDISNLLNTGEVPNLFDSGEQAGIGENVRCP
eukprot:scaffold131431_cov40-Prasinocladus_malaysianus.AAC.1